MEVSIERYHPGLKQVWNNFIKEAKNGIFLFDRNYLEYHADRFNDHSLLFYKNDELLGILAANERGDVLQSHGGLTYGGLVLSKRAGSVFVLEAFQALIHYLANLKFATLIYKAIPYIFHRVPAQEDLYALHRSGAQLYRRDISSVIDLSQPVSYTKGTKSNLSRARKANLHVEASTDFQTFMDIEEEILRTKYNTKPTHTSNEIQLLASRFPDNIKLYMVFKEHQCLGGTIIYQTPEVLHTQYIGINQQGKEVGALDFLTDYLLRNEKGRHKYLSFGISTEQEGKRLNEGLIRNKESFGARAVVNDFYKIDIKDFNDSLFRS